MTPIIEVKNLSKKYKIGEQQPYLTLRDSLANLIKNPFQQIKEGLSKDEFWALKDLNFSVEPGEVVGIIGRNGAGKSTLLKVLSRITPPSTGEIVLRGRVGSLLEVGTGFQQELTGRENIFLNGAILGMSQREIKRKFAEIVDFAEVEQFIDTPVKHYSSGMYMRLAFSIAAHLDPEILIVDEVLAVGDAEFQKKCIEKMDYLSHGGKTVLLVSHNLPTIETLANQVVVLDKGRIVGIGATKKILSAYNGTNNANTSKIIDHVGANNNHLKIDEILVNNKSTDQVTLESSNPVLSIKIKYQTKKALRISLESLLKDEKYYHLAIYSPGQTVSNQVYKVNPGKHTLEAQIILPPKLHSGTYYLDLSLSDPKVESYVHITNAIKINFLTSSTSPFQADVNGAGFFELEGLVSKN